MTKEITRGGLAEALLSRTPPIVLEALPRKYFDAGHIPTARPLPLDELDRIAPAVATDKSEAIVVYCASVTCQNSHQAAERLAGLGYSNVAVYAGGKQDWKDAGLRLEI
jgi:rhodanese-related sulfurtransferase